MNIQHPFLHPIDDVKSNPNEIQIIDVVDADEEVDMSKWDENNRSKYNIFEWKRHTDMNLSQTTEKLEVETDGDGCKCRFNYTIRIFGVMENGQHVMVKVNDYKPNFYIKIDATRGRTKEKIIKDIRKKAFYATSHLSKDRFGSRDCQLMTEVVKRTLDDKYYGGTKFSFLKVSFHTDFIRKRLANSLKKEGYMVVEDHIPPLLRFFHERNIEPFNWIKFTNGDDQTHECECDYEFTASYKNIDPLDKGSFAPFKIAAFDLECTSADGSFPMASNPKDEIIQIGVTVYRNGDPLNTTSPLKYISCLGDTDEIDGAIVECAETERDMLINFINFMKKLRPDVWTGYNINGFDFKYLWERLILHKLRNQFHGVGWLKKYRIELFEKKLESMAYGDQTYFYCIIPGQISCDLMTYIKREKKYTSYKLDYVANKLLGLNKHDITPAQIFEYHKKDSAHRKIIAEYCIQDCLLCNQLMEKLLVMINCGQLANVCTVPILFIFYRGQGIKGMSVYSRKTMELGMLTVNTSRGDEDGGGGYQGATVLNAKVGIYMEPIGINDFSALYPSCAISHNISRDTFIDPIDYSKFEGEDYIEIKIDNCSSHRFIKCKNPIDGDPTGRGVLPQVCMYLLAARKSVKMLMKKESNPFVILLLDARQLAFKVTCNSMYGLTGFGNSTLYKSEVAESITSTGRDLLIMARDVGCELIPGTEAIYGDSVTGETPILLMDRLTGKQIIEAIEDIAENEAWVQYRTTDQSYKEQNRCYNKVVWSGNGWSGVNRIIRHMTNKKIYRITTRSGWVDVTEDHSLLNEFGVKITPRQCTIGTRLLHGYPSNLNNVNMSIGGNSIVEEARQFYRIKSIEPDDSRYMFRVDRSIALHLSPPNPNEIINIEDLGYSTNYVYDLETESGMFQAGVGQIIVHNTDSVFYKFPVNKYDSPEVQRQQTITYSKMVEKEVDSRLPYPHSFEFEKVYHPFILFKKKRYTGPLYECAEKYSYIDKKGLPTKRCDYALIMTTIYGETLNTILLEHDIDKSINKMKSLVKDMLMGKMDDSLFITSKSLKSNYKFRERILQAVLADKMKERDPGSAPKNGDRVPFVFVKRSDVEVAQILRKRNLKKREEDEMRMSEFGDEIKYRSKDTKLPASELVEHPDYVKKHKLKLDYLYYLDSQIKKPMNQLLGIIMMNRDEKYKKLFDKLGQDKYEKFMNKELQKSIWNKLEPFANMKNNLHRFFK